MQGWQFRDEGKRDPGGNYVPKWGWLSSVAEGPPLQLRFSSLASAGGANQTVTVQLGYLQSYQHMGMAELTCSSGGQRLCKRL